MMKRMLLGLMPLGLALGGLLASGSAQAWTYDDAKSCAVECVLDAKDCKLDARDAFKSCLVDEGCDELRDAARDACHGVHPDDAHCSAAKEAAKACPYACRDTLHEEVLACTETLMACLAEDCGVDRPQHPGEPEHPEEPEHPRNPWFPIHPGEPEHPVEPEHPKNPWFPIHPGQPVKPVFGEPGQPGQPGHPGIVQPGQPGQPGKSEPGHPWNPVHPGKSWLPIKHAHPGQSSNGQPGQPGESVSITIPGKPVYSWPKYIHH